MGCRLLPTIRNLQQGFGQDAAGHGEGLADVVAGVDALHRGNGQLPTLGHGEVAVRLRRLAGEEQALCVGGDRDK